MSQKTWRKQKKMYTKVISAKKRKTNKKNVVAHKVATPKTNGILSSAEHGKAAVAGLHTKQPKSRSPQQYLYFRVHKTHMQMWGD